MVCARRVRITFPFTIIQLFAIAQPKTSKAKLHNIPAVFNRQLQHRLDTISQVRMARFAPADVTDADWRRTFVDKVDMFASCVCGIFYNYSKHLSQPEHNFTIGI